MLSVESSLAPTTHVIARLSGLIPPFPIVQSLSRSVMPSPVGFNSFCCSIHTLYAYVSFCSSALLTSLALISFSCSFDARYPHPTTMLRARFFPVAYSFRSYSHSQCSITVITSSSRCLTIRRMIAYGAVVWCSQPVACMVLFSNHTLIITPTPNPLTVVVKPIAMPVTPVPTGPTAQFVLILRELTAALLTDSFGCGLPVRPLIDIIANYAVSMHSPVAHYAGCTCLNPSHRL